MLKLINQFYELNYEHFFYLEGRVDDSNNYLVYVR